MIRQGKSCFGASFLQSSSEKVLGIFLSHFRGFEFFFSDWHLFLYSPGPERKQVQACRARGEQQLGRSSGSKESRGGAGHRHGSQQRLLSLEVFLFPILSSSVPVWGDQSEGHCAGSDVSDRLLEEGHDGPGGHHAPKIKRQLCGS